MFNKFDEEFELRRTIENEYLDSNIFFKYFLPFIVGLFFFGLIFCGLNMATDDSVIQSMSKAFLITGALLGISALKKIRSGGFYMFYKFVVCFIFMGAGIAVLYLI